MNIVADCNIPLVREVFGRFGRVDAVAGREIRRAMLRNADMLLVRSVTRVDRELLSGTKVTFVGTATIGVDHIDREYLGKRGIGFAAAPGSNANSVAQYVAAALMHIYKGDCAACAKKTLGIIGGGNVGSRVVRVGKAMGMRCIVNDPPLQEQEGAKGFSPLDEVIQTADIVTLHVPLTRSGGYPTAGMVDDAFIQKMKPGAVLINTSRGPVVREKALCGLRSRLGPIILDVWENEPSIDFDTLASVDIATPHIAGYSYDGKVAGTRMIFDAACAYFRSEMRWDPSLDDDANDDRVIDIRNEGSPLLRALRSAYPIMEDDARLRKIIAAGNPALYFDELRKTYPKRLEFRHFSVTCSARQHAGGVAQTLRDLQFRVR